jgi:hypothetical protein
MITSTMMLELVSNRKYWIDALHNKVISLLKGISTLRGGYIPYLLAGVCVIIVENVDDMKHLIVSHAFGDILH